MSCTSCAAAASTTCSGTTSTSTSCACSGTVSIAPTCVAPVSCDVASENRYSLEYTTKTISGVSGTQSDVVSAIATRNSQIDADEDVRVALVDQTLNMIRAVIGDSFAPAAASELEAYLLLTDIDSKNTAIETTYDILASRDEFETFFLGGVFGEDNSAYTSTIAAGSLGVTAQRLEAARASVIVRSMYSVFDPMDSHIAGTSGGSGITPETLCASATGSANAFQYEIENCLFTFKAVYN